MEVVSEEQLAEKLNFVRPLHPEPEKADSTWCIPFEYGANQKGTRISISLAKTISAELRAAVAEVEKRELRRALDEEKKRIDGQSKTYSELQSQLFDTQNEVAILKQKLRNAKRGRR